MDSVSSAEAKAHLSELVDRAVAGEPIHITRPGKPVAQPISNTVPRQKIDIEALRAHTASMPFQSESAGTFMRRVRDEDRY